MLEMLFHVAPLSGLSNATPSRRDGAGRRVDRNLRIGGRPELTGVHVAEPSVPDHAADARGIRSSPYPDRGQIRRAAKPVLRRDQVRPPSVFRGTALSGRWCRCRRLAGIDRNEKTAMICVERGVAPVFAAMARVCAAARPRRWSAMSWTLSPHSPSKRDTRR
jgi:hypothetical protein